MHQNADMSLNAVIIAPEDARSIAAGAQRQAERIGACRSQAGQHPPHPCGSIAPPSFGHSQLAACETICAPPRPASGATITANAISVATRVEIHRIATAWYHICAARGPIFNFRRQAHALRSPKTGSAVRDEHPRAAWTEQHDSIGFAGAVRPFHAGRAHRHSGRGQTDRLGSFP